MISCPVLLFEYVNAFSPNGLENKKNMMCFCVVEELFKGKVTMQTPKKKISQELLIHFLVDWHSTTTFWVIYYISLNNDFF